MERVSSCVFNNSMKYELQLYTKDCVKFVGIYSLFIAFNFKAKEALLF